MNGNSEKLPREFGKYHLIERIATGGMAELYRAKLYGAGGFEKDLAIKKVLPQLADDDSFTKMFMDEAMITVTLSHGNIVSVIDFGVHEGDYYLVMEFVDGVDLQSLIRKSAEIDEPFPTSIASYIALEVCRGLDYAHRKVGPDGRPLQIVHRDISPQNILISFEGEVKIVDFGIARAASRITSTQAGVVKGKLAYMAPEQISGQQVDRRADVYSVGVSLYEMLTCRRPFEGSTPPETLAAITRGAYEKPHKLNRKVDKRLTAVVRKALERNLKKRYQTAGEMAADLSSYLHRAGIYPDATTLAAFIPQRLPDAKPRTIQPTPIRAIRRESERQAAENTGVMGTPAGGVPRQPADADAPTEAVSFDMLGLDSTAVEPADSRRPTDPQYPARQEPAPATSSAASASEQAELLAAQTVIREQAATEPESGRQTPPSPPADGSRAKLLAAKTVIREQAAAEPEADRQAPPPSPPADGSRAELLAAKTMILEEQQPAGEETPGKDAAATDGERAELLAAKTMILEEQQPEAEKPESESAAADGQDLAERWLQGEAAGEAAPAADQDTGAIKAAAFSRKSPLGIIVAGAVVVAIAVLAVVFWPPAERPPEAKDAGQGSAAAATGKIPSPAVRPPAPTPAPSPVTTAAPEKTVAVDAGVATSTPEKTATEPAPPPPVPQPAVRAKPTAKKPAPQKAPTATAKPRRRPATARKRPQVAARPRGTGTLRINSEPFSVIYLGRKKLGPTPQMNLKLPAGSHTLTLRNDALGIKRRIRVRIQPNKIHTVFVDINKPGGKK